MVIKKYLSIKLIFVYCLTIGLLVVGWIGISRLLVNKENTSWQTYASTFGFQFEYPNDWTMADAYTSSAIALTKNGVKFFTPRRPDVFGRNEYRPLIINRQSKVSEDYKKDNPDNTWTSLRCGKRSVPKMLHAPYMDLYYIDLPSNEGSIEFVSLLEGMVANNIITQKEQREMQKITEHIICSLTFLSEAELEALNKARNQNTPTYYDPPTDLTTVSGSSGWQGISSAMLGFSLYAPADWQIEFDKQAPVFSFKITPLEPLPSTDTASMQIRISRRMDVRSYDTDRMFKPTRTETVTIKGQKIKLDITDYQSRLGEPDGTDMPQLFATVQYIDEDHVVYGYLSATGSAQQSSLNTFREIISKLNLTKPSEVTYEWKTFRNESLQFSVQYPEYMEYTQGGNRYFVFQGPVTADGKANWPRIEILPKENVVVPLGSNVEDYITERYQGRILDFNNNLKPPIEDDMEKIYATVERVNEPVYTISGQPTVHYRLPESDFAMATDYFYVINYNQLLGIKIVHTGNKEDWALYKQFLDSIAFDE